MSEEENNINYTISNLSTTTRITHQLFVYSLCWYCN